MRALMDIDLKPWEPFFTTAASAVATLAGLLFVSLSLNKEKLSGQENKIMLRLAQLCFADYLYVLLICLVFLIPKQGDGLLAIELFFIGLRRCFRLLRHARDSTHELSRKLAEWQTLRNYALPGFCAVGLMVVSVLFNFDQKIAPYLVATILLMLTAAASWNTWLLLVIEKDYAKRA
jgi:hypothetical protein